MKEKTINRYTIIFIVAVMLIGFFIPFKVYASDTTKTNYTISFTSEKYEDNITFDYPNKNVFCYKQSSSLKFYYYNDNTGESELIDKTLVANGVFTVKYTVTGKVTTNTYANNRVSGSNIIVNETNMQVFTSLSDANTYFESLYTPEEPTVEPSTEEPTVEPSTEEPTVEPSTEEPTVEPSTEEPTVEPSTEEPTVEPSFDLSEEQENLYNITVSCLNTYIQICLFGGFMLATLLSFIGYGVFKAFSLLNINNRT